MAEHYTSIQSCYQDLTARERQAVDRMPEERREGIASALLKMAPGARAIAVDSMISPRKWNDSSQCYHLSHVGSD